MMTLYDKLKRITEADRYDEELYLLLNSHNYVPFTFQIEDRGAEMSIVSELIGQYWKPRFIMDHTAKCAYEFMNHDEYLVTVTENDIDWDSLVNLPDAAIERAKNLNGHFPTNIRKFENGVAEVEWKINPDGRYYEDDEGFGMTDDIEIAIFSYIDRTGKALVKFRNVNKKYDLLKEMRAEAEKKANAQNNDSV